MTLGPDCFERGATRSSWPGGDEGGARTIERCVVLWLQYLRIISIDKKDTLSKGPASVVREPLRFKMAGS